MNSNLLPWHRSIWTELGLQADRKAHALLFSGPSGTGKRDLALHLGMYRFCEAPIDLSPCGVCHQCALAGSGSHPDLHVLMPESDLEEGGRLAQAGLRYRPEKSSETTKPKRGIVVDQVRRLTGALSTHPRMASVRMVVVALAETMNLNAANAFLKILEEPPPNTQLILVSTDASRLLPTLRSRCSPLELPLPSLSQGVEWLCQQGVEKQLGESLLRATGRQPLTALKWHNNNWIELREELFMLLLQMLEGKQTPLEVAKKLTKYDSSMLINWIVGYIESMIRTEVLNSQEEGDLMVPAESVRKRWPPRFTLNLFRVYDYLLSLLNKMEGPGGLDEQLVLEDSLLMLNKIKTA